MLDYFAKSNNTATTIPKKDARLEQLQILRPNSI